MAAYGYTTKIDVRYRDLDPLRHVNNAVYVTYLEQARAGYLLDVLEFDPAQPNMVVASLSIDYRRPSHWGETVTVGVRSTELGGSSFGMEYEIRADGEVAATAETVQVTLDEAGDSRPVPEEWRERIREHEGEELDG